MKYLLDTCALIWLVGDPAKISETTQAKLIDPAALVAVSSISIPELACAAESGRVVFNRHWKRWFRDSTENNGWEVLPVTQEIAEEAYSLPEPFHRDPADRMLVATARVLNYTLVTGDKKILQYPHVESIS